MKKLISLLLTILLTASAFCEEAILPAETRDTEAVLYYPSTDLSRIVRTNTVISVGSDRLWDAISALSLPPFAQDVAAALPGDCRITSCENTFDTLTVSLESSAPVTEEAAERFLTCAALTAGENSGVKAVAMMLDGMSAGCMSTDGKSAFILYLPANGEDRVVPYPVRENDYDAAQDADRLISALFSGTNFGYCSSYPASAAPDSWHYETAPDGRSMLVLDFSRAAYTVLAVSGVQKWQLMASVALSFCTCLPRTERVLIRFAGGVLNSYTATDGALVSLENGLLRRDDFLSLVCAPIRTRDESGLPAVGFLPLSACPRPEAVMMRAASLPFGSINAVRIIDDAAWVDLSGTYLSSLKDLSPDEERDKLYRMVNALCENFSVTSVRFLTDGRKADYFASGLWLGEPFIYNPGF